MMTNQFKGLSYWFLVLLVGTAYSAQPTPPVPAKESQAAQTHPRTIKITDMDLPFEHKMTLKKGEAVILMLPNGKNVAFWCEGGTIFDDTDLALNWAERPFQQLECNRKRMPDGSQVLTGWKSYIRQGTVTTWSGKHDCQRELFVEKYRITLRDSGDVKGVMPVTVNIRLATEKELLHGDAEREHYVKQLKSSDANERLAAIKELQEMAELGSIYEGDPKDMIATMRPLTEDRNPKVQAAARLYMCRMGDETSLLALVTPEPKGEWRGGDGASRIADFCVRHKCPAVSKHVLTFFDSKDEALFEFAVAFFERIHDPAAKPQMLAALKHKDPNIRAMAVSAIRFLCKTHKETADNLVPLLRDSSRNVILAALLEANWVNDAIPPGELTRLLKDPDPEIRRMAAYALDCCRQLEVIDPLLESTKNADASVRAQAAVSLGRIGTPKSFDRLIELLGDDNPKVRENAVNGLRWLKDKRAIPHIQKLLQDEKDRGTRDMAVRAIREMKF